MKELIMEEANDDLVTKVQTDGISEGKTNYNGYILIRIKKKLDLNLKMQTAIT